jgi:DHA2 family multidrug resistance protein
MILMPGGFVLMAMFPLAGILSRHMQPKYMMLGGLIITILAMYHLTSFNAQVSFSFLVWARVFQCLGLPLFFLSLNTMAYSNLPPGKSNNASALLNLWRNLGGSVGISVAVTLLDRRTQMHQDRLVSRLTPYDQPFLQMLRRADGPNVSPFHIHPRTLINLYQTVQQQATMLSYLDVFKIMSIGCLIVLVLVLFLPHVKRGAAPAGGH